MHRNGFAPLIIIGIIAAIAIVGVVGYFSLEKAPAPMNGQSPQQAVVIPSTTVVQQPVSVVATSSIMDVSEWKEYQDSDFGVSFEYPKTWVVQTDKLSTNSHSIYIHDSTEEYLGGGITISQQNLPDTQSAINTATQGDLVVASTTQEGIGSFYWTKVTYKESGGGNFYDLYLKHNQYIITVGWRVDSDASIVGSLLQTFHFLPSAIAPSSLVNAIIWNTYTSKVGGYQIQYPAQWIVAQRNFGVGSDEVEFMSTSTEYGDYDANFKIAYIKNWNPSSTPLIQWAESHDIFAGNPVGHISTATIDGYPAYSFDMSDIGSERFVYFSRGTDIISIEYDSSMGGLSFDAEFQQVVPIYQKILSTFQFIPQKN